MQTHKTNVRYMATLAMLCGVLLVMGMTGIGFIPLPVIKATTMHIPIILGAILLGPAAGGILGGTFVLCLLSFYDHGRSARRFQIPLDRLRLPNFVWHRCRLALEAFEKVESP